MKFRASVFFVFLGTCLVLTSCDRNPGWDGHESADPKEELAEDACKCVYEVMSGFEEFDADDVLQVLEEIRNGKDAESNEKFAAYTSALSLKDEIMDRVDGAECMKPIEDGIFNRGLEYEDLQQVFASHCLFSAFFRF